MTFNEITKNVVQESIARPREIDQNLVDAQQARRVLDRIVGYELSPLLWKKVRRGLSAGRVQSVATRMVDEREKEIESFKPEEYWTLDAQLLDEPSHKTFTAHYYGKNGKKFEPSSREEMRRGHRRHEERGVRGQERQARGQAALALPAVHHLHAPAGGQSASST